MNNITGFEHHIYFSNSSKIQKFDKSYNKNYQKIVKCFVPSCCNCSKNYFQAVFSVAINNTFPKKVIVINGILSDTDYNCYNFDLTELYAKYCNKQIGRCEVKVINTTNNRVMFKSQTFYL